MIQKGLQTDCKKRQDIGRDGAFLDALEEGASFPCADLKVRHIYNLERARFRFSTEGEANRSPRALSDGPLCKERFIETIKAVSKINGSFIR